MRVGHAMATVATAGVSSHDAGLGYFQSPAIEWIATLFMLLSAMPFVLYIYLLRGQVAPLLTGSQVRLFVSVILAGVVLLALWRLGGDATSVEQAFREAAFNVVSIISTTGFVSHDFHLWGGFASLLLLCAMLMGGCTGSTAGGIKMFRLAVLLEVLRAQIRRQILPSGVFHVHYNRQPIPNEIVTAVITYGFAYLVTFSCWPWPWPSPASASTKAWAHRRRRWAASAWASARASARAAPSSHCPTRRLGCSPSA